MWKCVGWVFRLRKRIEYVELEDGCFRCTSHFKNRTGYHVFQRNGKKQEIHRYLYTEKVGRKLKYEEIVCHTCHNKWCINTDHMYLGSKSSNAFDAVRSGSWNNKLTSDNVKHIRRVWNNEGVTAKTLANELGVSPHTIYHVTKTNGHWGHVLND